MATLDEKEVLIDVIKGIIASLTRKGYSGTPIMRKSYQKKSWIYLTDKEDINYRNTMNEINNLQKEVEDLPSMHSEEFMKLAKEAMEEAIKNNEYVKL